MLMGLGLKSVIARTAVMVGVFWLSGCGASPLLGRPANFRVVSTLGGSVWLDWDRVQNATVYRIDRRECPDVDCTPSGDFLFRAQTGISSFVDDAVTQETTFEYALTAYRDLPGQPLLRSPTVTLVVTTPHFWWENGDPDLSDCTMALNPNPLETGGARKV